MDEAFKRHLADTYGILPRDLERLEEELLDHYRDTVEEWVRHRHYQLQNAGMRNAQIFETIIREAELRRFAAGGLSERRVRRIIYG